MTMANSTRNVIASSAVVATIFIALLGIGINADCRSNERDLILWQRDEAIKEIIWQKVEGIREDISDIKISIKGIEAKI